MSHIVPRDERGWRLDFGFNLHMCCAYVARRVQNLQKGVRPQLSEAVVDIQTEEIQNEVNRIYMRNQLR